MTPIAKAISKKKVKASECCAVIRLQEMMTGIRRGMEGAGLRAQFRPNQVIRIVDTLKDGNQDEISALIRDVAGEAASLSAGGSLHGSQAVVAICDAHAQLLIAIREKDELFAGNNASFTAAQKLLMKGQQDLIYWVEHGVLAEPIRSDLPQIGQAILVTPELRQVAIAVSISSAETMLAGMGVFTSPS